MLVAALLILCVPVLAEKNQKKKLPAQSTAPAYDSARFEQEYQTLRTELKLAKTEKVYLVIDLKKMELIFKLKGAKIWTFNFKSSVTDTGLLLDFQEEFLEDNPANNRLLEDAHLFAGKKQTPDSILQIVSKVSNVSADLLQRHLPERFQLIWDNGLIIDVRTDLTGTQEETPLKNTILEMRQALASFGETILDIYMPHDPATTLFRAADPGLPTMVYPR
jgi:hypothetical protein